MSLMFRTRRHRVALVAAAAVLAVTLSGCGALENLSPKPAATRDADSQEVVEEGQEDVFAIMVGDCLDEAAGDTVTEVPVVPCDEEHDEEVFADFELAGDEYPGDDEVAEQANDQCYSEFASFVGLAYEDSTLDFYPYTPTQESWDSLDDRVVSCVIWDPEGPITGTLASAAR